jgi:alcohol dehydrogenase (cytochrome c)
VRALVVGLLVTLIPGTLLVVGAIWLASEAGTDSDEGETSSTVAASTEASTAMSEPASTAAQDTGAAETTEAEPTESTAAASSDEEPATTAEASNEAGEIVAAPAFSTDELWADPGEDWITNGGSTKNQRYSPLDEINDGNIGDVKGVWKIDLGSATAAKYSAEAQPIVYKGTIYLSTGEDDVYAVDAKTGQVHWKYEGDLDQKISTVCCGWLSRGVGLGDGMVFIGKLDGSMVALDQMTGEVKWQTQVVDWKTGGGITAAPLYYDGKVITGITGGEFGIRGRVQALDAKTGKELWRFWTVPGPGEVGHDTWPQDNDAWQHGGAPVWQTPSVDPETKTVFFTTGNASPDINGSQRAGDNLFAASFVALDVDTGKYKWHFQTVHHDIWDFDQPSPTVLFDAEVDGETVPAIGEAGKTGWLYLLDRRDGTPIVPIEEKPVPQDAYNKTAATQPYPSNDPVSPHEVDDRQFDAIKAQVDKINEDPKQKPKLKVNRGKIFDPQTKDAVLVTAPDATGGTNWQPSSYNPETGYFYVCSQEGASGYSSSDIAGFKEGEAYVGSIIAVTGFGNNPGHLTAIEGSTGKIVWDVEWDDSCYSGSTTTKGNLVFAGRNNGELKAFNAESGDELWSFQTGAGANNSPTFFELDGKEYFAYYAGGNSLAASPHGDELWVFGLDGTMGPAPAPGGGEGTEHAGEESPESGTTEPTTTAEEPATAGAAGDASAGEQVFADNCSVCHGALGTGGNGGPDISGEQSADVGHIVDQVTNGGGGMPAFGGTLSDQQIADVAAYVNQRIHQGG